MTKYSLINILFLSIGMISLIACSNEESVDKESINPDLFSKTHYLEGRAFQGVAESDLGYLGSSNSKYASKNVFKVYFIDDKSALIAKTHAYRKYGEEWYESKDAYITGYNIESNDFTQETNNSWVRKSLLAFEDGSKIGFWGRRTSDGYWDNTLCFFDIEYPEPAIIKEIDSKELVKIYRENISNFPYRKAESNLKDNNKLSEEIQSETVADYDEKDDLNVADRELSNQPSQNYIDEHLSNGEKKFAQSDYLAAIQDFSKSIDKDPNQAEAYHMRGIARLNLEKEKEAFEDFSKAIQVYEKYVNSEKYIDLYLADDYFYCGRYKWSIGDKNGACQFWKKAAKLGNDEADSLVKENCPQK